MEEGHSVDLFSVSFNGGESNMVVRRGNLVDQHVDCIVNAANGELQHGSGVARAIANAAGEEFEEACRVLIARQGKIRTGQACVTRAGGRLHCKMVVHTVGPVWNDGDPQKCCDLLRSAVRSALSVASHHGAESVAIPAISSGIYGFPKDLCAKIMISEVTSFLSSTSKLRQVVLTNIDDKTSQVFKEAVIFSLLNSELVREVGIGERVAGCAVLYWTMRDQKMILCGGREVAGQYAGMFNMAGGNHDEGERRIDTLRREFYEEMGCHFGRKLDEREVLDAPKVMVGKTIVALIEHRGGLMKLSRKRWNERAKQEAISMIKSGRGEMDRLELFDAETFPSAGSTAMTLASSKGVSTKVSVTPLMVAAVDLFRRSGHVPYVACKYWEQGSCPYGDKCRYFHRQDH